MMDIQQNILDELNKDSLLKKLPVTETGLLDIHKIMSYELDFTSKDKEKIEVNPDDQMVEIKFPSNLSPELAAEFLIMVNASALVPNKTDDFYQVYFVANKKILTDFVEKYSSLQDLHLDPKIGKFYNALVKGNKKIKAPFMPDKFTFNFLKYWQPDSYKRNKHILIDELSMREKVNFMFCLCADDVDESVLKPKELRSRQIYKQFILQYIDAFLAAETTQEKEEVLDRFSKNAIIDGQTIEYKIGQMADVIGKLKNSKNLYLPVLLDDGSYVNLFELDNNTEHHIMCSVDVSKINQITDFSNLIINGDFFCENAKKPIILPKIINGSLDLYAYPFISDIIHIPTGVIAVNLTHCIKSFEDLNKLKFPETVTTVWVARSLINKALKNPEELKQIQIFADKHPNIKIFDDRERSLQEALEQKQQEPKKAKEQPVTPIVVQKQEILEKTNDWLTRKEIIDILSKDSRFVDVKDLDRLIKRATNTNSALTENKMVNSQSVLCVHVDNIENVANAVLQIISEEQARVNKKEQSKKASVKKDKKAEKSEKQNIDQPEILEIEKYIPKNIWKDICSSCKDSSQLLHSVLDNINKINVDYTKQKLSGSVQYIGEDGQFQVISDIDKKEGRALGQTIEKNDKRRIVWTINPADKIIVATAFFETHAETIKVAKPYQDARKYAAKGQNTDGISVTYDLVIKNNYLKVSDLLKQLETQKSNSDEKIQNPVIEEHANTPEPKQPIATKHVLMNEPVVVPDKKTYIKPEIKVTEKSVEPQPKIDLSMISNNNATAQKRKRYTVRNLVDVKAIEAELTAKIAMLDREIKRLSIEMGKQKNNPQEQLIIANMIIKKINEKIALTGR